MTVRDLMDFTGERFIPEVQGNIELEHYHRYLQAAELAEGKTVLDIASGEGYGSALLAVKAARVIGVDIDRDAVDHAKNRYQKDNLTYVVGNCADIPLPTASIDLVVSFETIEHHEQHEQMMLEIKRVLKPDGILLISSPDKRNYSDIPGFNNPYHVKELYDHEFKKLIESHFRHACYYSQRVVYGSLICSESLATTMVTYRKEREDIQCSSGLAQPIFWIALASEAPLPRLTCGIFEQPVEESESYLLKAKDLSQAVELLKLKDEFLATAAELIRERDARISRSIYLPWLLHGPKTPRK
jgi:ubiquinone/menaquinone biosynthesis C-methylase UbiE